MNRWRGTHILVFVVAAVALTGMGCSDKANEEAIEQTSPAKQAGAIKNNPNMPPQAKAAALQSLQQMSGHGKDMNAENGKSPTK